MSAYTLKNVRAKRQGKQNSKFVAEFHKALNSDQLLRVITRYIYINLSNQIIMHYDSFFG